MVIGCRDIQGAVCRSTTTIGPYAALLTHLSSSHRRTDTAVAAHSKRSGPRGRLRACSLNLLPNAGGL